MPGYDYQCESCGYEFEVVQKITEDPLQVCPKCNGKVHRLLSPSPFILKGSGWYVTDYARKDTGGKAAEQGNAAGHNSGSKSTEKKETKTAKEGSGVKEEKAGKSDTAAAG